MKIIHQDGDIVNFDSACVANNRPDARFNGETLKGRIVGHQNPEGTHVYAQCPKDSPARYIWKRFIVEDK